MFRIIVKEQTEYILTLTITKAINKLLEAVVLSHPQ